MKKSFELQKKSLLTFAILLTVAASYKNYAQKYTPTWESVNTHDPAPEWFQDAKFGIYFHWGVYTVPASSECWDAWYGCAMYSQWNKWHIDNFGDPTVFPYHAFINGQNDKNGVWRKFEPKLVSQGGFWDPDAWAQLFVDAGARFAGPVAEHHDGYAMWDSQVNPWNAKSKAGTDYVGELEKSIRAKGLKFIATFHHANSVQGQFYPYDNPAYAPALSKISSNTVMKKLYGTLPEGDNYKYWYDQLIEVIDKYKPDLLWHDMGLPGIPDSYKQQYLAYYYNKAVEWGKEVGVTYKVYDGDAFGNAVVGNGLGEIIDYERGGPTGIVSKYWLTDESVTSEGWSYTTTNMRTLFSTKSLLHALIDKVSKNGSLLLNITPKADGTIPQEVKDILTGMGGWLGKFGEAVYSTRAWTVYGEGPTKMGSDDVYDQFKPVEATNQDIRFTRSKNDSILYAIVLGWPGEQLNLSTLKLENIDLSTLTNVQLLGANAGEYIDLPGRIQDSIGFKTTLPSQPYLALAYVIKLTFGGIIPKATLPPVANNATGVTPTSFNISWKAATSGTTKYFLDIASDSIFQKFTGSYHNKNVGNVSSESITGLTENTTYYIRLRAGYSAGNDTVSGYSNTITVKTAPANGYTDYVGAGHCYGVTVTTSSVDNVASGQKTVDGSGLTGNKHDRLWENGWCSSSNTNQWIKFDLGRTYNLSSSHIWNGNEITGRGLKVVNISYSVNGTVFTPLITITFPQATGANDYAGFAGPNFGNVQARYIKFTEVSSYGDNWGVELAEVKFYISGTSGITDIIKQQELRVYPTPATSLATLEYSLTSNANVIVKIFNINGQLVKSLNKASVAGLNQLTLDVSSAEFRSGLYFIKVSSAKLNKIVKMNVVK